MKFVCLVSREVPQIQLHHKADGERERNREVLIHRQGDGQRGRRGVLHRHQEDGERERRILHHHHFTTAGTIVFPFLLFCISFVCDVM